VRGDVIEPAQFDLWMTYYGRLLSVTRPEQRLVTHTDPTFMILMQSYDAFWTGSTWKLLTRWSRARALISRPAASYYVRSAELIEAETLMKCSPFTSDFVPRPDQIYIQARRHEAPGEQGTARANEISLL